MPILRLTGSQFTGGVSHRGEGGRSRSRASYPATMQAGLAVAVATLAVATVIGLILRRRNGRFQAAKAPTVEPQTMKPQTNEEQVLTSLGVTPGPDVTLLQFSTVFCGPCRTTRALCAEVARTVPGVR